MVKGDRIVLFGFFFGALTTEKKSFWVDSLVEEERKYLVVENDYKSAQEARLEGFEVVYFPANFSKLKLKALSLAVMLLSFVESLKIFASEEKEILLEISQQEKELFLSQRRKSGVLRRIYRTIKVRVAVGRLARLIEEIELGSDDVLILWGQHLSAHRILTKWAKERGATVLFTEGSELQGSLFVSERGILNLSWPSIFDKKFRSLSISDEALNSSCSYLNLLNQERFSNKEYDSALCELSGVRESGRPVVYVNGLENFASGLRPRCAESSRLISPNFASNNDLLRHVLMLADKHDWEVLYKDHPNTFRFNPSLLVKDLVHPRLKVLKNVDIHEVMDCADVMVSLCSKVVLLALARGVPVVLGGAFSVSSKHLDYGLEIDPVLESGLVKSLKGEPGSRVDKRGLERLVALLYSYYVYRLPGASWSSTRDSRQVWRDIDRYLAGESDVVSCQLRL